MRRALAGGAGGGGAGGGGGRKPGHPTLPAVPSGATSLKEEDTVPPMPPDAFVKVEVVVKEEEGSTDGRPKWQRAK